MTAFNIVGCTMHNPPVRDISKMIKPSSEIKSHIYECFIAYSNDSQKMVIGGDDEKNGIAGVFDLATCKKIQSIHTKYDYISSVLYLRNNTIALANLDGSILILNAITGEQLFDLKGEDGPIDGMGYDEPSYLYDCAVPTLHKWDLHTGKMVKSAIVSKDAIVYDITYNKVDNLVATCSDPNGVIIWNPQNLTKKWVLSHNHLNIYHYLQFTHNGKYLIGADQVGESTVWDINSRKKLYTVGGLKFESSGLTIAPSDKYFAVSGGYSFNIWNIETGKNIAHIRPPNRHWHRYPYSDASKITSIAFSPDGKWIATGGTDGIVQIWDFQEILKLSKQTPVANY